MFEDECHLIDIKLAGELALKNNIIKNLYICLYFKILNIYFFR